MPTMPPVLDSDLLKFLNPSRGSASGLLIGSVILEIPGIGDSDLDQSTD